MPAAELVVVGRIATLAGSAGPGWVEAIAIRAGRVVAAGSETEIEGLTDRSSRRIVLEPSEIALPGITDAHLHLALAAIGAAAADLVGASAPVELAARVAAHAATVRPGAWVTGAGWDAERVGRWPGAADLDGAAPDRLVALWAHDHHALLASWAALRAAGIGSGTPDPPGGTIVRGPDGRPTGLLLERAASLVADLVPAAGGAEVAAALPAYAATLNGLGVTGVQDPGGLRTERGLGGGIDGYRIIAERGALPLRVHASIRPEQLDAAAEAGLRSGDPLLPGAEGLALGWLKCFADGSLGSGTARLLEPLEAAAAAAPGAEHGTWVTGPAELERLVAEAAAAGIATQVHAIGDAAVRAALDALGPWAGRSRLRPRIEHVQLVAPADLPRFATLGVAASVQPVHIRADAARARRLWGARADASGYPFGRLHELGALVAFGTDAPVEPPDPWPGIACAIARRDASWPPGMAPLSAGDALHPWAAIRAATVAPPKSAGELDRGRLVAGHRADLVVVPGGWAEDPDPAPRLAALRPRLVLLGGRTVAGAA